MKFKLPDFDLSKYPKVYAGGRDRHATATAVSFVDENTILVASFLNKKIFLIDIRGDIKIISEIETNHYPDLMDYKDGLIIISNRSDGERFGGVSLFRLNGNEITHIKDVVIKKLKQVHGCRIIDDNNIVFTNTEDKYRGCYFMNLNTEETTSINNFKYYPKDVLIMGARMLIVTSSSRPSSFGKVIETGSFLYLFEYPSLKEITNIQFFGQTDCITVSGNNGFITFQAQDSLFHFKIENDILTNLGTIPNFNFPHGVASLNDKIIVTNYGDNSIDILNITDLI